METKSPAPTPSGAVIDQAVRLYRASFRRCAPIALIASLVSAAFGQFVLSYARRAGLGLSITDLINTYSEPPIMAASLLQSVLSLAFYGALISMLQAVASGDQRLGAAQAVGIGFTRLGRAVIAAVISTGLIVVGFVLLLVPGIFYLGALCLWPVALYADNAGAVQSLRVSRELIRGHWWRASSILSAAGLIVLGFSIVSGLAAGLFASIWGTQYGAAQDLIQLATALANVVVLPMVPATLVALYRDLKHGGAATVV